MYSVCRNSTAAEAPASAKSRCSSTAVRDGQAGADTRRLDDQGVREDLNVCSPRLISDKCLAAPSARIEHDGKLAAYVPI
ncbi:hypothetical protein LA080_011271 [Diaporthe eres]|nr:hypothetical protein LA080_011271 [Diaporthe eres]